MRVYAIRITEGDEMVEFALTERALQDLHDYAATRGDVGDDELDLFARNVRRVSLDDIG